MFNNFYQVSARWMASERIKQIEDDNDIEGEIERPLCSIF
jgi:hypothetical protein